MTRPPAQQPANGHAPADNEPVDAQHVDARAEHIDATEHHGDEHGVPSDLKQPSTFTVIVVAAAFVALLVIMFIIGLIPHLHRAAEARDDAKNRGNQTPMVDVSKPKATASSNDVLLPADVRADQETSIHPRTSGYLKTLRVDIGDRVKAGQLLAEVDTPEVDAQLAESRGSLEQSKASVAKSQEDADLAKRTLDRYEGLVKADTGGVTQQELDDKRSAYNAASSTLAAARANVVTAEATVQRLTVLQGFEKVVAPFDGVITARGYDLGALLSATDTTSGKEMFRVAKVDVMRVFVNVPQTYSTNIKVGQQAFLSVRNYQGREFIGTVARTAGALDSTTRTLPVELHFPNPDNALYAGMYGQARLPVTTETKTLIVPTSAVMFNADGLRVATVDEDNKVHFQKIGVDRDLGTEMEVTTGISSDDRVITNPGEKLVEGIEVKISQPKTDQSAGNAAASAK